MEKGRQKHFRKFEIFVQSHVAGEVLVSQRVAFWVNFWNCFCFWSFSAHRIIRFVLFQIFRYYFRAAWQQGQHLKCAMWRYQVMSMNCSKSSTRNDFRLISNLSIFQPVDWSSTNNGSIWKIFSVSWKISFDEILKRVCTDKLFSNKAAMFHKFIRR